MPSVCVFENTVYHFGFDGAIMNNTTKPNKPQQHAAKTRATAWKMQRVAMKT